MRTVVFEDGVEIGVEDDGLPDPVPSKVTPAQARRALRRIGRLAEVESIIAGIGGEAQDQWEYGTVFERHDPLVAGVTAALGMTDAEMDDLFRAAADI